MYKVEDYVVYRQLQVCKIESMETPSFESDKTKLYYKMSPVFDNKCNTVVYVPVTSEDGLRPLSDKEQVQAALQNLPTQNVMVFTAKKPPQLVAHYQEILSSCDIEAYLPLLKEVTIKEKSSKKLNEIDTRYRAKTERLLCEECAVVLGTTPEEIQKQIHSLL